MPVIFQRIIKREDLRRNNAVRYVFGDNTLRRGMVGQAAAMRGELNAIGVATKNSPFDYFKDDPASIIAQNRIIDIDMKPLFKHVRNGSVVIWPSKGIGTGLAALETHAPETFAHLHNKLAALIRVADLFTLGRVNAAEREARPHV